MTVRRRRKPGEEAEGEKGDPENAEAEAVPVETFESLKEADPQVRAEALKRMQKTHGNAAVQRIVGQLQVTDAGRDARVQSIGERAREVAPSGKIDRAILYREAIEDELDKTDEAGKTEREQVQDILSTLGQVFVNYQTALHMLEKEVQEGAAEAVPMELGKTVLEEFVERDLLGPVIEEVGTFIPMLQEDLLDMVDEVDEVREEERDMKDSAPARAIRNLVIAERQRVALGHHLFTKDQPMMMRAAQDEITSLDEAKRADYADEAVSKRASLESAEEDKELSAEQIFKRLKERWSQAARTRGVVTVTVDSDWQVTRAHFRTNRGSRLAAELMKAQGHNFDLGDLKLIRHVTWQPEEFALVEATVDEANQVREVRAVNDNGLKYVDELRDRLRGEGLPRTRLASGD